MPSAWVDFVKKFAAKKGISYGCAMSDPACKAGYAAIKEKKCSDCYNYFSENKLKKVKDLKGKSLLRCEECVLDRIKRANPPPETAMPGSPWDDYVAPQGPSPWG